MGVPKEVVHVKDGDRFDGKIKEKERWSCKKRSRSEEEGMEKIWRQKAELGSHLQLRLRTDPTPWKSVSFVEMVFSQKKEQAPFQTLYKERCASYRSNAAKELSFLEKNERLWDYWFSRSRGDLRSTPRRMQQKHALTLA